MSRGRPKFTESNRAIVLISSQERPKSKHISAGADKPVFDRASNRERETEARQLHRHDRPEQLVALSISSLPYSLSGRSAAARTRALRSRPSVRGSGYDEAQPCAAHAEHDDEGHAPSGRGAGDPEAVRKAPSHAMGQQHRSTAGGEMRKDKEGGKAIMRH